MQENIPKVFLTKVERKTIISKSLFYILLIFVISDQMVIGSIWFKIVPWIYILGFLSKTFFSKPFLTIVLVAFTTFVSALIKDFGITTYTLVITINSILMVSLGIMSGHLLNNLLLLKQKVLFFSVLKKFLHIIYITLITVVAININGYINGNIYSALNSRANLKSYVENTYIKSKLQDTFSISDTKYSLVNFRGRYEYIVTVYGMNINLVEVEKNIFKDTNYNERATITSKKLRENFDIYLTQNLNKIHMIDKSNMSVDLEYTTIKVVPDKAIVSIDLKFSFKETNTDYKKIIEEIKIINLYPGWKGYEVEYNITVGKKIATIVKEQIDKLNINFLKNSLMIEDI